MKRNKNQYIGQKGESLIQYLIDSNKNWISRKMPNDFGIDYELELCEPEVAGQFIKAQVKTTENPIIKNSSIEIRLNNKILKYAFECRIPIIIVVVDLINNGEYYIWLQEYIDTLKDFSSLLKTRNSTKIKIPLSNTFIQGLNTKLILIAKGITNSNLLFNLREIIKYCVKIDDIAVVRLANDILTTYSKNYNDFVIDILIDEILILGPKNIRFIGKGYEKAQCLYELCKTYGDKFSVEQVVKIIRRGEDSISFTGINALSLLYDNFFDHIKSMNLPVFFQNLSFYTVSYYCKLREKYPNATFFDLINEETNTEIDGFDIDKDYAYDKYYNRGPVSIFQSIEKVQNRKT